jgi:hypothetical protein
MRPIFAPKEKSMFRRRGIGIFDEAQRGKRFQPHKWTLIFPKSKKAHKKRRLREPLRSLNQPKPKTKL